MKFTENTLKKNQESFLLDSGLEHIHMGTFILGNKIPGFILGDSMSDAGTIWLIFIAYFGALVIFENSKVSLMSLNAHGKMI